MMNETMTPPQRSPQLVRPIDDRVIAGVASGLARRLDIAVGWIRVGFVVLSFFGGLGVMLYLIGWLGIRDEAEPTSIVERWLGGLEGSTSWLGAGLIVIAGMILLGATGIVNSELVLAAGLFLAGVLLYRGHLGPTGDREAAAPAAGDRPPTPEPRIDQVQAAAVAPETRALEATPVPSPPAESPPPQPPPQPAPVGPAAPPPPPPEPSYLGRITLASALIVAGLLGALDNLDVLEPGFRHYLGAIVLVVGIGLLVGAFVGRARGLIAVGLILTPVLLFAAAVKVPLFGEYGDVLHDPVAVSEIDPSYELSGGRMVIDLTGIEDWSQPARVEADLGIGELLVYVPADRDVVIDAEVGIGAMRLFGEENGGLGLDRRVERAGGDGVTDAVLRLDLGIGSLEVEERP